MEGSRGYRRAKARCRSKKVEMHYVDKDAKVLWAEGKVESSRRRKWKVRKVIEEIR